MALDVVRVFLFPLPTPNTIQLNQVAKVVGWGPINSRGKTAKRSRQLQAKQL